MWWCNRVDCVGFARQDCYKSTVGNKLALRSSFLCIQPCYTLYVVKDQAHISVEEGKERLLVEYPFLLLSEPRRFLPSLYPQVHLLFFTFLLCTTAIPEPQPGFIPKWFCTHNYCFLLFAIDAGLHCHIGLIGTSFKRGIFKNPFWAYCCLIT